MKEIERIINNNLTKQTQEGYSKGMGGTEPGNTEGQKPPENNQNSVGENNVNKEKNPQNSSEKKQDKIESSSSENLEREFVEKIDKTIPGLSTEQFKSILSRAKYLTSRDDFGKLYNEFYDFHREIHDQLFLERQGIYSKNAKPLSSEEGIILPLEDAARVAEIDNKLARLNSEREGVAALIRSRIGLTRDERDEIRGERQVAYIKKIYQIYEDLKDPTKDTIKLKEELTENEKELYRTLPAPENAPIDDDVLKAIGRDEAMTEKFVSRLIVSYKENDPYQMHGFYGAVNLDVFLKVNQDLPEDRIDRLENLIQANQAFHNMNYIIKRSFDQFVDQSKALLPKHFDVVMQLPGVATVFRAYERLMKEELGIETRVTEDALSRTKEDEAWKEKGIETRIKEEFKKRIESGKLKIGGFMDKNKLEPWEIDRAIAYGRNLYRASVRSAEILSLSELNPEIERMISAPQKELTFLLDPIKFITYRFDPNPSRGGVELAKNVEKKREEERREQGNVRLQTLGGIDTEHRGLQEIISARGFLETWRLTYALLKEVKFMDGDKITDVVQFFKDHDEQIQRFKDWSGSKKNRDVGWKREFKKSRGNPDDKDALHKYKKDEIRKVFGPLIDKNNVALGVLVSKFGVLLPIPTEFKELIWEKIPTLNPGAMASLLTRLEVDEKANGYRKIKDVRSLEQILILRFGSRQEQLELFEAKELDLSGLSKKEMETEDIKTAISDLENLNKLNLKDRAGKLLEKEEQLITQIETEKDGNKKENLKKILELVRSNLEWKPTLLKREIDELQKRQSILKGKESMNKISKKELYELDNPDPEKGLTRKLAKRKAEFDRLDFKVKELLKNERWKALKDKFELINEQRLGDEMVRIEEMKKGKPQTQPSKKFMEYLEEAKVTDTEMKIYGDIVENGQKISKDLANMKQITVWFLDDAPLDAMKMINLGQAYDRQTNDLGNFQKGSQKLLEFLGDPFAHKPTEVVKMIREAMDGVASVLSLEAPQENMKEFFYQYLEMINEKGINRQMLLSAIAHWRHKPTSRAQEITGSVESPALTEDPMFTLTQEALKAGVLRPEVRDDNGKLLWESTYTDAEKRLHLGWYDRLIKANGRDFGPFLLIALLIKFIQGTYSYKQK